MNGATTRRAPSSVRASPSSDSPASFAYPGSHSVRSGTSNRARQGQSAPFELRPERCRLLIGLHRCTGHDRHEIDEIAVTGGRVLVVTVPLVGRSHLVGDMIDQRICPVPSLFHLRNDTTSNGRDILRLARHAEIGSHKINVESDPGRGSDDRVDRQPECIVADGRAPAHLETKPVVPVCVGGFAQIPFGHLPCCLAVDIDVQSPPHPEVSRQERGAPLHDQSVVMEVETIQQLVIGNLTLQLLKRPRTILGCLLQPSVKARRNAAGAATLARAGRRAARSASG